MLWSVYVVRCGDGTLYTGITTDPERRLAEHNRGCGGAYTRSRLPVALVYLESAEDRSHALRREHAIKRMSRAEKDSLVDPLRKRRPASTRS
jgi:predicted GIY-YIG superfamily endonuclease